VFGFSPAAAGLAAGFSSAAFFSSWGAARATAASTAKATAIFMLCEVMLV